MPGSFPVFDSLLERVIEWTGPRTALDIGTGAGKVGRMLHRYAPGCRPTGIEVEASYVDRFGLRALYDPLHVADATVWCREHRDAFDLIVLGDCIEHLPKSAGLDLLNELVHRCAWLVVVAPEFVVQGSVDGIDSEAHRSVWSERDFGWHDLYAFDNCRATTFVLLRGYATAQTSLESMVERLNAAALPVRHFDGETVVRPVRLRLVEQRREVDYRPL